MMPTAHAPVPDVVLRHVEPAPPLGLPPLDVAAFVGFAERGPVHVPVAIEEMADLDRVLGRDVSLEVTDGGGETGWIRPYLRRAAESFLENGGRRCWVVRVTGDGAARAAYRLRFPAAPDIEPPVHPQILMKRSGAFRPMPLRASSEGSWADGFTVRARVRAVARSRSGVAWQAAHAAFSIPSSARWRPGDLLRLVDGERAAHLFLVDTVETGDPSGGRGSLHVRGRWLRGDAGAFASGDAPRRIEELTWDLDVRGPDERGELLAGMGFAPGHARYALDVLRTQSLYLDPPAPTPAEARDAVPPPVLIPDRLPEVRWSEPLLPETKGADDLGPLSPALFAPEDMDRLPAADLLMLAAQAQEEAYRLSLGSYVPDPVRLQGLLALLPVDEVALIGVPDALHTEPTSIPDTPGPEPTPVPAPEPVQPPVAFEPCVVPPAVVIPEAPPPPLLVPRGTPHAGFSTDDIVEIQRALVRLCALRCDMVAALAAPLGEDPSAWRWRVLDQESGSSYAAFYHPWVRVADPDPRDPNALRTIPPDGPALGTVARRERARRVWVAPANEPLRGVLALSERISRADWGMLLEDDINVIRDHPGAFRIMSARTLSRHRDLSQLNVRRLMIALKKALLRWGMDFVFESHTYELRSALRHRIERALGELFREGAFAGTTPEESFQVEVSDSVNPLPSVDAGHLVAIVKVAPSWPVEFIEVHLVRTGEGFLQLVEA